LKLGAGSEVTARQARARRGLPVTLAVMVWATAGPLPADELPAEIAGLLPEAASVKMGSWGALQTEYGVSFGSNILASPNGYKGSCDFTVGPELRVEIKGDTGWEEPPMLDMLVQMYDEEVARAREALPERLVNIRASNSDVKSVGEVRESSGPSGTIVTLEYTENCPSHPNGTNTMLMAFAREGATIMSLDLWLSTGAADARAFVTPMLESFQALDFAPLLEGATPE